MVDRRRFIALMAFTGVSSFIGFGRKAFAIPMCDKGSVGEWSYEAGDVENRILHKSNLDPKRTYWLRRVSVSTDPNTKSVYFSFSWIRPIDWNYRTITNSYTCEIYVDSKLIATEKSTRPTFTFNSSVCMSAFSEGRYARLVLSSAEGKFLSEGIISLASFKDAWSKAEESRLSYKSDECKTTDGGCFITTATCGTVGLADNCFELTAMRNFRDNYLAKQPGGQEQIKAYYKYAPEIVQRVESTKYAKRIWLKTYFLWILPVVILTTLKLNLLARFTYSRMVNKLSKLYLQYV